MKAKGHILVDNRMVADTAQCVHCNGHFQIVRGSGRVRGFCTKCMGPTCGSRECDECVPFEKRLEIMEKG